MLQPAPDGHEFSGKREFVVGEVAHATFAEQMDVNRPLRRVAAPVEHANREHRLFADAILPVRMVRRNLDGKPRLPELGARRIVLRNNGLGRHEERKCRPHAGQRDQCLCLHGFHDTGSFVSLRAALDIGNVRIAGPGVSVRLPIVHKPWQQW